MGGVRRGKYKETMYDPLTSRYSLSCPHQEHARLPLSAFRVLERLPGPAHPPVFSVRFQCACGDEHQALLAEQDLDLAPLGATCETTFLNLMTGRDDALAVELGELAARRIQAGEWPWSFYCYLEDLPRQMTPSSIALIAPGEGSIGVAVRCPSCAAVSVNLVTHAHVDIPFWNDRSVGVVDHVFEDDAVRMIEEFRAELRSARFDERRLDLER